MALSDILGESGDGTAEGRRQARTMRGLRCCDRVAELSLAHLEVSLPD